MKKLTFTVLCCAATLAFADELEDALNDLGEETTVVSQEPAVVEEPTEVAETPAEIPETPAEVKDEPVADTEQKVATDLSNEDIIEIEEEMDDAAEAARRPTVSKANGDTAFVDIECDDATLADILRQFRKTTGANIINDDSTNLQRRVSVTLRNVPWKDGLREILSARGFRLDERENIFRVIEDKETIPVTTRTFTLNHASAKELAQLFNDTYGRKDANGKIVVPVASYFEGANVVVVTAIDKILAECEAIIKAVDKAIAQIYIEARFIEVDSNALHKLGMNWKSLGAENGWGATQSDLMAGIGYARNPFASLMEVGDAPGNLSGTLTVDQFRLAMNAFESIEDAKIFSNPKIIVANGKEALIDMTTKFPNVTIQASRTNNSGGNSDLDISARIEQIPGEFGDPKSGKKGTLFAKEVFFSYGIELTVKPRIAPNGLITVEIYPTISYLDKNSLEDRPTGFFKVQGGENGAYSQYPVIKVKRLETEFTMQDGSTAVIGGLSKTEETDIDTGIPYLRKIPWVGQYLFGGTSRQKVQREIIIFVTLGMADPANLETGIGLPTNATVGRDFVTGVQKEPGFRDESSETRKEFDVRPVDQRPLPKSTVLIPKGGISIKACE